MGRQQLRQPTLRLSGDFHQLGKLGRRGALQDVLIQQQLDARSARFSQLVVVGNLMAQRQYRAMQMEQYGLTLGLHQRLGIHGLASLGFAPVSKDTLLYKLYKGCMNCAKYDNPLTCPEVAMAYHPATRKAASP